MKKTFSIENSNHKPARVIDSVKSEIRKYIKRERKKKLPDGADFWDFDCKAGADAETAKVVHVAELNASLDQALEESWSAVYIELLAKPATRTKKEK